MSNVMNRHLNKIFWFFFEWRCTFCGSTISHYLGFFMQTRFFLQKHAHFIFLSLKSIQNTHRLLSLSLFLSLCHSHTYTQSIHMLSMLHIWIISLIWLFLGFVLTCVTREGWVRTLTQSLRRDDIGKVLNFFPPVCRTRIDPYFSNCCKL